MNEPAADVTVMSATDDCAATTLVFAKRLRQRGVSSVCDTRNVKLKKKLEASSKMRCYYSVIIGTSEQARGCVQIKDMDTGIQVEGSVEYALNVLEYMLTLTHTYWTPQKQIQPDKIIIIKG